MTNMRYVIVLVTMMMILNQPWKPAPMRWFSMTGHSEGSTSSLIKLVDNLIKIVLMITIIRSSLCVQSSYLSRISQIIFVEKPLSCGEIWSSYKEFEQFVEFYQSLCRFCSKSMLRKIYVEKKWQIWGPAIVMACIKIWPTIFAANM